MSSNPQAAKSYRLIEFILLFIAMPTLVIIDRLAPWMMLFLWAGAAYCYFIYKKHRYRDFRDLLDFSAINWKNLKPILIRWIFAVIGMVLFLYWYDPARLLSLLETKPLLWLAVMLLYPPLSALPQQFIYCCFFFERYGDFFKQPWLLISMSALAFGFAHVLFINPVAPVLSLVAGFIFAESFYKTRSLSLVALEHTLYGNALFTIGLGWYFYGGHVH